MLASPVASPTPPPCADEEQPTAKKAKAAAAAAEEATPAANGGGGGDAWSKAQEGELVKLVEDKEARKNVSCCRQLGLLGALCTLWRLGAALFPALTPALARSASLTLPLPTGLWQGQAQVEAHRRALWQEGQGVPPPVRQGQRQGGALRRRVSAARKEGGGSSAKAGDACLLCLAPPRSLARPLCAARAECRQAPVATWRRPHVRPLIFQPSPHPYWPPPSLHVAGRPFPAGLSTDRPLVERCSFPRCCSDRPNPIPPPALL